VLLKKSIHVGGVVQVEDHLPSKSEALSSIPNTAKNPTNQPKKSIQVMHKYILLRKNQKRLEKL
jgi:hypothetical protein